MHPTVILVDDDEALLRMLATDHFEDAGYEVIEAANGRQALTVIRARPDVRAVFTDIQMPGTPDGLDLAKHVRAVNPECAIVVVSGRIFPSHVDLAAGARFVSKPYEGKVIVELVGRMIGFQGVEDSTPDRA